MSRKAIPRFRRTRDALGDALLSLMQEEPLETNVRPPANRVEHVSEKPVATCDGDNSQHPELAGSQTLPG